MRPDRKRRSGAHVVESALVLPVMVILLLGMLVLGVGMLRQQQVTCAAREGARWASLRGADYQRDADRASPTQDEIRQQAVLPVMCSLDPAEVSVKVEWIDAATNGVSDWDDSPKEVRSITSSGEYVTNRVRVTVTYRWVPGGFFGQMTISSVCEIPMSF